MTPPKEPCILCEELMVPDDWAAIDHLCPMCRESLAVDPGEVTDHMDVINLRRKKE